MLGLCQKTDSALSIGVKLPERADQFGKAGMGDPFPAIA
jgi:hypothetical protein